MKRSRPYNIRQAADGTFVAAGEEPLDSPPISLRLTKSQYAELEAVAGKKKASLIREAIKYYLEEVLKQT